MLLIDFPYCCLSALIQESMITMVLVAVTVVYGTISFFRFRKKLFTKHDFSKNPVVLKHFFVTFFKKMFRLFQSSQKAFKTFV